MVNKILTVYDYGDYTTLLLDLVKHFKEVRYYCLHEGSYPRSNVAQVGKGIEGVIWLNDFDSSIHDTDIFFFPGNNAGSKQVFLRSIGKNVFGSGKGDELENYRYESNKLLGDYGLPNVEMDRVYGMDALREYLKKNDKIWVKTNFRGDYETFYSKNYDFIEPKLDKLEYKLGMLKRDYEFICCKPIDGDDVVESGVDLPNIDGQYPEYIMQGLEIKDLGYLAAIKAIKEMSPLLTDDLIKLSPVFKEYQYRNFFSSEKRIKDGVATLTDFTCRCGSPPSELFFSMIENLGEVIDMGSQGILVEPIYKTMYGMQAIITSDWAEKDVQPIMFPDEIKDFVKIKNLFVQDGKYYYLPINDVEMSQIGSVIAYEDSLDKCFKSLKDYCEKVSGIGIKCNIDSMDDAMEEMEKCKKIGIKF